MLNLLSWGIGFWEAEGTVGSPNKGRGFQLSASQKNREPLDRLVQAFECGKVYGPYDNSVRHVGNGTKTYEYHIQIYRWMVGGKRARQLAEDIYPFLSKRRQEQLDKHLELDVARPRDCP